MNNNLNIYIGYKYFINNLLQKMIRLFIQKTLFNNFRKTCVTIVNPMKNTEKEAAYKRLLSFNFICWMERGFLKKETLEYFIESGVDVSINDNYALMLACELGDVDMMKRLELAGASIKSQEEKLLKIASHKGHLNVLKYLVYRSDTSTCNTIFHQFLIAACINGHLDIVKFLVENGVDIHTGGTKTCFQVTTDEKIIEFLNKHGQGEKCILGRNNLVKDILLFIGYYTICISGGVLFGLGIIYLE